MKFVKGDTIELEITANTNISSWEIRAEIYDKAGHTSQIATTSAGVSSTNVTIDDATNGVFTLLFDAGETTNFEDDAWLEIERTEDSKVLTIFQGKIKLSDEKITWSTPS